MAICEFLTTRILTEVVSTCCFVSPHDLLCQACPACAGLLKHQPMAGWRHTHTHWKLRSCWIRTTHQSSSSITNSQRTSTFGTTRSHTTQPHRWMETLEGPAFASLPTVDGPLHCTCTAHQSSGTWSQRDSNFVSSKKMQNLHYERTARGVQKPHQKGTHTFASREHSKLMATANNMECMHRFINFFFKKRNKSDKRQ
jgi:hypothetical protein